MILEIQNRYINTNHIVSITKVWKTSNTENDEYRFSASLTDHQLPVTSSFRNKQKADEAHGKLLSCCNGHRQIIKIC